jgi:hypothetical protein
MTTAFLVVWLSVSYDCPWGLGKSPKIVKELVCTAQQKKNWTVAPDIAEAERIVSSSKDQYPLVLQITGEEAHELSVTWKAEIKGGKK